MTAHGRNYQAPLIVIQPTRTAHGLAGAGQSGARLLAWALACFVIAMMTALLGFGGIAAGAAPLAKLLCLSCTAVAVTLLVAGLARGRTR